MCEGIFLCFFCDVFECKKSADNENPSFSSDNKNGASIASVVFRINLIYNPPFRICSLIRSGISNAN
jgi:hypothetical protein